MKSLLCAVAFIAAAVSAAPAPPSNSCDSILLKVIDDVLHVLPQGTPFCSTFLNIAPVTSVISSTVGTTTVFTSTSTSTVTVTTATTSISVVPFVTPTTTGTATSTSTSTTTTTATSVVTTVSTSQILVTVTATALTSTATATTTLSKTYYPVYQSAPPKARSLDERDIVIPPQLINFAKSEITSACSCLNLATPTVQNTVSVTSTVLAVVTTTTTVVATNSVVVVSTQTIITAVGASTTIGAIDIVTNTITATTTPVASVISTTTITPPAVTVTSTSTVTTTATVTSDPCDPTTGVQYFGVNVAHGDFFYLDTFTEEDVYTGDLTAAGCCRQCFQTAGCAFSYVEDGKLCGLLINSVSPVVGADATCPTGLDTIDAFSRRVVGLRFPQEIVDYTIGITLGPCFAGQVSA